MEQKKENCGEGETLDEKLARFVRGQGEKKKHCRHTHIKE